MLMVFIHELLNGFTAAFITVDATAVPNVFSQ